MSECPRCRERGQTWPGSPPKCAFPNGVFVSDNWNCATMNALRHFADKGAVWSDDNNMALLSDGDGGHLLLGWYKSHGATELARIVRVDPQDEPHSPTLAEAEAIIRHNTPRCRNCDVELSERRAERHIFCSKKCEREHEARFVLRLKSFGMKEESPGVWVSGHLAAPACEPSATPVPAPGTAPTSPLVKAEDRSNE